MRALGLADEPGGGGLLDRRDPVHAGEIEHALLVVRRCADEAHHADEHVPAGPRHARKLGDGRGRAIADVGDRPAEADGRVEARLVEGRQVGDVRDDAGLDRVLDTGLGELRAAQLEAGRGRCRRAQRTLPDPRECDRETAGPGAGVEHPVTRPHEPAQVSGVRRRRGERRRPVVEAPPLALGRARAVGHRGGLRLTREHLGEVLVAAAGEADDDELGVAGRARGEGVQLSSAGRMPFVSGEAVECGECVFVGARYVLGAAGVSERACSGPTPG